MFGDFLSFWRSWEIFRGFERFSGGLDGGGGKTIVVQSWYNRSGIVVQSYWVPNKAFGPNSGFFVFEGLTRVARAVLRASI